MFSLPGRAPDVRTHLFADDGVFPNSRLPVLVYRRVIVGAEAAGFEQPLAILWRAK